MRRSDSGTIRDEVFTALALLTRLPVPDHAFRGAASAWAWPLAGVLLATLAGAAGAGAGTLGVAPGPAAALVLAVLALATGGLHEDGLADTADGLMGGQDRARRLEIMKDSRIGSYGAVALVLVLLAQWSALAALIPRPGGWLALAAAAALSRGAMAVVMAALPNARAGGLSAGAGRPAPGTAAAAAGIALAVALACLGRGAIAPAFGAVLAALLVAAAARTRIGGQTGDILGATQMTSFAAALALA